MSSYSKRIFIFVLISVLMISIIAGCNKTKSSEDEKKSSTRTVSTTESEQDKVTEEEKPLYTIKMLYNLPIESSDETELGKYIKEKFGIVFEFIPYEGNAREKQNLMLAAGDYGELQYMQRDDIVMNYINAGALISLEDYLDEMPDFAERYKDIIPYWRIIGSGTLYKYENLVPKELATSMDVYDIYVRTDALEKQGWPNPLSTDGWVAFLRQAVKDFPGSIGMTLPMAEAWGLQGIVPVLYEKSDKHFSIGNEGVIYNHQTKAFEDYFKNSYVKESFEFFNQLYREGLLDVECFTDLSAKTAEKLNSGKAISTWYVRWLADGANKALRENGKEEMQYMGMPVQSNTSVKNGEKRTIKTETTRSYDSWGITDKAKHPERLIELINWACTDEGQITLTTGFEGVHWERIDGKRVLTETFYKTREDSDFDKTQGLNFFKFLPYFKMYAQDGQPHNLREEEGYIGFKPHKRIEEALKNYGWLSGKSWYKENGFFATTGLAGAVYVDPATDIGKVHLKMTEFRNKTAAKLILADSVDEFNQIYNEALEEYEKLNPELVIDEFNRLFKEKQDELEAYK